MHLVGKVMAIGTISNGMCSMGMLRPAIVGLLLASDNHLAVLGSNEGRILVKKDKDKLAKFLWHIQWLCKAKAWLDLHLRHCLLRIRPGVPTWRISLACIQWLCLLHHLPCPIW